MPVETIRSADGTAIALERRGSGPPLIVVGGALSDRQAPEAIAEALSERLSVIAYDRRGRGDSGDTAPYAVDREVEDLAALIDTVGGSAFVFGHSSGAVLALEAARGLEAGTMLRLALYEPPFIVDRSRPPMPADAVARLEELVAGGRRGEAVEYFLLNGPMVPVEALAEIRASRWWPGHEAIAHTTAYDVRVMGESMGGSSAPLRRFASVAMPTLVVDGGASPSWQHAGADAIAEILPDARRETLPGQGHSPAPELLAPVLTRFFTEASS